MGTIVIKTRELVKGRRRSDNWVVVSLADDGCGITAENLKKVFDLFFTTREIGVGTGLGMSVSHDIVMAHQGSIKVDSEVGVCITFTVELPVEIRGSV